MRSAREKHVMKLLGKYTVRYGDDIRDTPPHKKVVRLHKAQRFAVELIDCIQYTVSREAEGKLEIK